MNERIDAQDDARRCHCCGETIDRCRDTYRGSIAPVTSIDVLAVMDGAWRVFASQSIRSGDGADFQADAVKEARAAVAELIEAARPASATLSHAYHTTLTGKLADFAHADYQRLDAALARVGRSHE